MEQLHYQLQASTLTIYTNLASSVVNERLLLGDFMVSKSDLESRYLSVGLAFNCIWQNQVPQQNHIHISTS